MSKKRTCSKNFYQQTTTKSDISDVSQLISDLEIAVDDHLKGDPLDFKNQLKSNIRQLGAFIEYARKNYTAAYNTYKHKDYKTALERSKECSKFLNLSFSKLSFVQNKSIILKSKKDQYFRKLYDILTSLREQNNTLYKSISIKTQPEQFTQ